MRIAYVSLDPGVPVFGSKGCSLHVQEMICALQELGHRVSLFTPAVGGEAPAGLANTTIHRLPMPGKVDVATRERRSQQNNPRLIAALGAHGPFDLVYERYSLWGYAGMEYAHTAGIPGVLEVNAPLIEEQARYRSLHDRVAADLHTRRCFKYASVITAVSRELAHYLDTFPQTAGKVTVINNGINPRRFPERIIPARIGHADSVTVGFVGTLKPWHGLDLLVDGFAMLREAGVAARLLVVGDGPQRAELQANLTRRRLSDYAELTGAVATDRIPALLASMDIAVAPYPPSRQFYFSPLKVFEYMAAGLPVVASDIGQLKEVIESERDGVLVSPGDVRALGDALVALAHDPARRRRLGDAARAKVLERWTWTGIAEQVLDRATHSAPLRAEAC